MKERPGFMIYFEMMDALNAMGDVEAGLLFKALMAYAKWGEVPELSGMADIAFKMLRGRMDRDAEFYVERCKRNQYNAYLGKVKRLGAVPMEFEEWLEAIACDGMPTITTTTTTTTTATTNPTTNPNPNTNTNFFSTPNKIQTNGNGAPADTGWVLEYLQNRKKERKDE